MNTSMSDVELAAMAAKYTPFAMGKTGNDVQTFYEDLIKGNGVSIYQSIVADQYRAVMPSLDNLRSTSKIHVKWDGLFGYDVVRLNDDAARYLQSHYEEYADVLPSRIYHEIESAFSCRQMIEIINGKQWARDYSDALSNSIDKFLIARFEELRMCGLNGVEPIPVTREHIVGHCMDFYPSKS